MPRYMTPSFDVGRINSTNRYCNYRLNSDDEIEGYPDLHPFFMNIPSEAYVEDSGGKTHLLLLGTLVN
jgi:hypothetical protein